MAFRADAAPTLGRTLAEDLEIAVAAGEVRIVEIGFGELARHRQLRKRAQQGVVVQIGGDVAARMRGEGAFEIPTLRPLVVDLTGTGNQAAVTGRTLIGEHHLVGTLQNRSQGQDCRVDCRHRNMAVQRALFVHREQLRRQLPADVE